MMGIEDKMDELRKEFKEGNNARFCNNRIMIDNEQNGMHIQFYIAKGNKKLPKDWWIANTGSGTYCISDLIHKCQYGIRGGDGSCYCIKAERQYNASLECRRANEKAFGYIVDNDLLAEYTYGLLCGVKQATTNKMSTLRFNESGDIVDRNWLRAMDYVATHLTDIGIMTYCYTHRDDLDYDNLETLVVNGSDFMIHNEFRVVDKFTGENYKCCGDCGLCRDTGRMYCTQPSGRVIEVLKH